MKTLTLTLKEPYYSMTGEKGKDFEIRKDSKWIRSRLMNKDGSYRVYDEILIINGYGAHGPRKTRKYCLTEFVNHAESYRLPNGENYEMKDSHFLITMSQ